MELIKFILSIPYEILIIVIKILIFILNLIPTCVYEVHGLTGNTNTKRPDLRDIHFARKGKRKLHLGGFIIAWTRGVVIRVDLDSKGTKALGVYSDDLEQIKNKWFI